MSSDPPHNPPEWDREYELQADNARLRALNAELVAACERQAAWTVDTGYQHLPDVPCGCSRCFTIAIAKAKGAG